VPSSVDAARQQWEEGNRRLESQSSHPEVYLRMLNQLEVATDELRKRVGETFTLAELADAYGGSDHWLREAVEERAPVPGWQRQLSVVQDAAFHLESRVRRRGRRPAILRWVIGFAVLAVVFGLGVAVGQALDDRPRSGKPVTNISTIRPWTQTQP
jgi:hypothetical protein